MSDNYRLGPSYKVPQNLPDGWVAKQLGELVQVVQGGQLGLTKEKDYISSGIPAYSAAGQDGFVNKAEFYDRPGVILSAIGANCGRCFYAEGDWTTLANTQALLPSSELNARFLYYRVNMENYWERSGSAQPFIKPSSIKRAWIAYPEIDHEQQHIVDILSSVDESIEQTEGMIAKTRQIKASLMQNLLTGRTLDPNEWYMKPLSNLAQVVSGGTPSRYVKEYWEGGTIPWVTPTDITSTGGRFLSDTQEHITEEGLHSSSATLLPAGTILMTSRATLGEIKIATRQVCTNQGFKSLIPLPQIHGPFLYYQMLHNRERYSNLGIGSTFLEVNKRDTDRFEVLVPSSLDMQRRIASILMTVDETIEENEALLAKLKQVKAGLMQDLLTGRVRVPVAPSPSDTAEATADV